MSQKASNNITTGHLFNVEILIEDASNGLALEKLLQVLNTDRIKDYNIKSGIELGKLIDLNVNNRRAELPKTSGQKAPQAASPSASAGTTPDIASAEKVIEQLESFKTNNTLIRLTVIKAKGIKLSLPCRILNYDNSGQTVTVYHVDEKKVYLFKLNEIEDFSVTS
ncbi:hypothetical protein [Paenibacillus aestuarii]|uniref:Uncharacterized protein n=1 Tax=Paenibacillus aestuarii TaxID=516965 RepID=A0ABW0KF01_9BACL|nr:hypothetical protein [Paenibacillus aestuarii]